MLIHFGLNVIDTFNIVYLWIVFAKKDINIFKFITGTLVASILMTITESMGINFFVTYVIGIVVFRIFLEKNFKDAILGYFLSVFIIMILQLILLIIVSKLPIDDSYGDMIIELIISMSIIICSRLSISKKIPYFKMENNILVYFATTFSIYASVFKIIWNYDNSIILKNPFFIVVVLFMIIISQIILYLYTIKGIKEREQLRISSEYNVVISEIVQEIRQRQHDFVNYKNTIKGIIEVVDEKEIKQAIIDYIKDEDMNDNHINDLVYIDNVIVRSVVYNNLVRARKCDVNLRYTIENNVLDDILRYHDISNLLSNLLNNAFDEVMKDECINKDIGVNIFKEKNISHLVVKNQIANGNDLNLNEIFKRGYSTKDEGTRGYGLYNVQQIVNANKGYIKLNVESGEFVFDIYFNSSG